MHRQQQAALNLVITGMNLLQQAKTELLRSNADKKHPFRYCNLSTLAEYPETRMVVIRKIDQNLNVIIYTDSRTPKVQQLQKNNKASLLFYHPKKRLQVRMKGKVRLIQEGHPAFEKHLSNIHNTPSLRDYTTLDPPGSLLKTESVVLGTVPYFTVIIFESLYLDILLLQREGHIRSEYFLEENEWIERRLVP